MGRDIPKELHIILALWGTEYIDDFFGQNLFTRLSEQNFQSLCNYTNVIYKIYTNDSGEKLIKQHSGFKLLTQHLKVKVIRRDLDFSNLHLAMNSIHCQAIEESYATNAALIFDSPDVVYCKDFFCRFIPLIKKGKRCLLIPSMRLDREAIYKDSNFIKHLNARKCFSDVELMEIGLNYLHPHMTESLFIHGHSAPYQSGWFSHIYWKVGNGQVMLHGYHYHPFYIWPKRRVNISLTSTIDGGEFIAGAIDTKREMYTSKKEDGLIFFELSKVEDSQKPQQKHVDSSPLAISTWSSQFAHPFQKRLVYAFKYFFINKKPIPIRTKIKIYKFLTAIFFIDLLPFSLRVFWIRKFRDAKATTSAMNYHENLIYMRTYWQGFDRGLELYRERVSKTRAEFISMFIESLSERKLSEGQIKSFIKFVHEHFKKSEQTYLENLIRFLNSQIKEQSLDFLLEGCSRKAILNFHKTLYRCKNLELRDNVYTMLLNSEHFINKFGVNFLVNSLPVKKKYYDLLRPYVRGKKLKYILSKKYAHMGELFPPKSDLNDDGLQKELSKRQRKMVEKIYKSRTRAPLNKAGK